MPLVWVTRWALSRGVFLSDLMKTNQYGLFWVSDPQTTRRILVSREDFKITRKEAIDDAEARRDKRIRALEKQRDKLANMTIKVEEEF